MKQLLISLLALALLSGCTYYQSATIKDDKVYIITNEGFGGMIWDNRIHECEKTGGALRCTDIKGDYRPT